MKKLTMTDAEWIADVENTAKSVQRQNQCGANRPVELSAEEVLKLVGSYRLYECVGRLLQADCAPETWAVIRQFVRCFLSSEARSESERPGLQGSAGQKHD